MDDEQIVCERLQPVLEKNGFTRIGEEIGMPYKDQEIIEVMFRLDA